MGHSGGFPKRVVRYVRAPQQATLNMNEREHVRTDRVGKSPQERSAC